MDEFVVDPVFWTRRGIISLGPEVLKELAQRSSATVHAYKLLLGRCLLTMDETGLHEVEGYSSSIHYAVCVLGLAEKDAYGVRRVAFCLETLPVLTRAAELGQVSWGKLSEIVRKASPETEAAWLAIASKKNCREIEKLVRSTEYGKLPWDEDQQTEAPVTRVTMNLNDETRALLERAVHSVSQAAGKPLSTAEVLEQLVVEHLAKRPVSPEVLEAARQEGRRGVAAHKMRNAQLIEDARELARDLGWSDEVDPLQAALSGEIMTDEVGFERPHVGSSATEQAEGSDSSPRIENETEMAQSSEHNSTHVGRTREESMTHVGRTEENSTTTSIVSPEPDSTPAGVARGFDVMARDANERAPEAGDAAAEATPERTRQSAHVIGCPGAAASGPQASSGTEAPKATERAKPVSIGKAELEKLLANAGEEGWMNRRLRYNPRARSASPAQRLELLMRDGHRCRTPGCPHRLWLELHHRVYFSKNGQTTRANLLSLCSRCHSNEQKGFLIIEQDAEGRLTFKNSKGENLQRAYASERANWLNFWIGWNGGPDDFHRPTTDDAEDPLVILEAPVFQENPV